MTFTVGDRVGYNPVSVSSGQWRDMTWRIAALTDRIPGQRDYVSVRLESDDGRIERGINTASLVAARNGSLDRNGPVTLACPRCGERALLLPQLGDWSDYYCTICHDFSVDGTIERCFELGTADLKNGQLITENGQCWLRPL
jgi:hypothetical protein